MSDVCAICGSTCSTGRRLAVDHDHETGEVRGLLCLRCNVALGAYEKFLPRLLDYLSAPPARRYMGARSSGTDLCRDGTVYTHTHLDARVDVTA